MKVSFANGGVRSLGEMSSSLICDGGITLSDTLSIRAEYDPLSKATWRSGMPIEYQMRRRISALKGNGSRSQDVDSGNGQS